jgi:hypothetical protein
MSKRPRAARPSKRQRPQPSAARPRRAAPAVPATASAAAPAAAPAAVTAAPVVPATSDPEPRSAPPRPAARPSGKPSGLLAQKAANEYVYVAQDLRRIGTFAAAVTILMLLVWVLVDLVHVVVI